MVNVGELDPFESNFRLFGRDSTGAFFSVAAASGLLEAFAFNTSSKLTCNAAEIGNAGDGDWLDDAEPEEVEPAADDAEEEKPAVKAVARADESVAVKTPVRCFLCGGG